MHRSLRKLRLLERKFLKCYSAWQETHRLEFAEEWLRHLGELLRLNPGYSARHPFQQAF